MLVCFIPIHKSKNGDKANIMIPFYVLCRLNHFNFSHLYKKKKFYCIMSISKTWLTSLRLITRKVHKSEGAFKHSNMGK